MRERERERERELHVIWRTHHILMTSFFVFKLRFIWCVNTGYYTDTNEISEKQWGKSKTKFVTFWLSYIQLNLTQNISVFHVVSHQGEMIETAIIQWWKKNLDTRNIIEWKIENILILVLQFQVTGELLTQRILEYREFKCSLKKKIIIILY